MMMLLLLLRKYRTGRRPATCIVACLDCLSDRAQYGPVSRLFVAALEEVCPVPRLLWRWGARHIDVLDWRACVRVLEFQRSATGRWLRLDPTTVAKSEDALEALVCTALHGGGPREFDTHVLAEGRTLAASGFNYSQTATRMLHTLETLCCQPPCCQPPHHACTPACHPGLSPVVTAV